MMIATKCCIFLIIFGMVTSQSGIWSQLQTIFQDIQLIFSDHVAATQRFAFLLLQKSEEETSLMASNQKHAERLNAIVHQAVASSNYSQILQYINTNIKNQDDQLIFCNHDFNFEIKEAVLQLCSHVVISFAGLATDYTELILPLDINVGAIRRLVGLKSQKPSLKVLIGVGGWFEGSVRFSNMVANEANRKTFIETVMTFISDNKLDGFHIYWHAPTWRGGHITDKENYVLLLKEVKTVLRKNNLLLTAALIGNINEADQAYNLPQIDPIVDYFHLYSYDYNGVWTQKLGLAAPLHPYKEFKGIMCSEIQNNNDWQAKWVPEQRGSYMVNGKKWLTCESSIAIAYKMQYIQKLGFAGALVMTLGNDDYEGICGEKFPLLNAVHHYMNIFKHYRSRL